MFYPIDLLSHRRRGKFAPCWLAAMTSEKSFKRYYNSGAIKKMNVVQTCEEILQVVQLRSTRSDRFSLYLSSQLMCGITRIHSYQIAGYQKEIFEFRQKLNSTSLKKKEHGFDAIEDFDFPAIELPLLSQNVLTSHLGEDLHILPGEDPDDRLQIVMQDATCLNFGYLNDEELQFMLERDDNILLDQRKRVQISKEIDISESMANITITERRERQLSQEMVSPVLIDISKRKNKSREKLSLTPQKRQPHQIQVETPTKRRRLSFETEALPVSPVPVEDMTIPAPELPVEETRVPPLRTESDMELESLDSSYFIVNRHLKKDKIIDKRIALTDEQLRKWRQDIKIYCKDLDRPLIHHRIRAINLFKQPSHLPKQWNSNLLDNVFLSRIVGPFTNVDDNVAPAERMQFQEAMRVEETINRQNLPTEELSTFAKTDTAIGAEPADSVTNILPMADIVHETADVSVPPLPEVIPDAVTLDEGVSTFEHRRDKKDTLNTNNIDETLEDIETLLERGHVSKTTRILETSAISTRSSPSEIRSREVLTMLENLWQNEQGIKFSTLMPKDTYTREEAAIVFTILLEFHAQKKLILQQTECFRTLRIFQSLNF